MSDEVDFVYNTRLRGRNISSEFYMRLQQAMLNDIQHGNLERDEGNEHVDAFIDHDDDIDLPEENDASDIETDMLIEPNELTDSDEEIIEEEDEEMPDVRRSLATDTTCIYGKDGSKWEIEEPNANHPSSSQNNIRRFEAGPKIQTSNPLEVFKLFFTPNISLRIISETNRYAKDAVQEWNAAHPNSKQKVWNELTSNELDAFLGILLTAGASRSNMLDPALFWHSDALPIFRAAMSFNRFRALTRYIRFDDGRTRKVRQRTDKAAPIRDIWDLMNGNLAKNFEPNENITIDEQLFPYRGRTQFTQYIPSKPAKYGIKIWWACDSKTKYPLHGKLYTGRNGKHEENLGANVMIELASKYTNTGRTIIADNCFTTLEGTKQLAEMGLSFVGTIRSNNKCLPEQMKKDPARPVGSTIFGFYENLVSICSYVPKQNKTINLLSTVHHTKACNGLAKKPEALLYYNAYKTGVDCMDQMLTQFTTKTPTERWTYALFCNILDVMALATFIICKQTDRLIGSDGRRTFLNALAKLLVLPNVENRMNNPKINSQLSTRLAIESFIGRAINIPLNVLTTNTSGADTLTRKRDCKLCSQGEDKLRRKTRFYCSKCTNPVCQQHSKVAYSCFACNIDKE